MIELGPKDQVSAQRALLQIEAVRAEAAYGRAVQNYISAAIANANRPALWAAEARAALDIAAAACDAAMARWTEIRSRLARLPAARA